jgi:hypothetical protein
VGNEAGANGKDAQLAQDTTAHAEPGFLIPRGVLQDDLTVVREGNRVHSGKGPRRILPRRPRASPKHCPPPADFGRPNVHDTGPGACLIEEEQQCPLEVSVDSRCIQAACSKGDVLSQLWLLRIPGYNFVFLTCRFILLTCTT